MKKYILPLVLILCLIFSVFVYATSWDVSTATYANKSKNVNSQEGYPRSVTFNSDGNKMYIVGYNTDTVYQYALSTSWDVSTATYASKSKDVSSQDSYPYDVTFNSDGNKMYIMGYGTGTVYQYALSTPWDVSTATYANKSKDVSNEDTYPLSVTFNLNGNKMYIMGYGTDTVYQYTLEEKELNAVFFGINF